MGCHAARGESNTGVLESPVGVKKPRADHADLRPCQLAAQPHVPVVGQTDHIVIEKREQSVARYLTDCDIVYLGPIERHLAIDDPYMVEPAFDFGECEP